MSTPDVPEVTVHDYKTARDRGDAPLLLDVRRPDEYATANLDGVHIPLQELPDRVGELEAHRDEQIVVHCRSGARSARAVEYLRAQGYDAVNLKGGILAWKDAYDPSLPAE